MGYRGSGYFGSDNIKTSTSNQEIIQQHKPSEWSIQLKAYRFSFSNKSPCHVSINNSPYIFLDTLQGFNMTEVDAPVYSFKIQENGVLYNYFGAY